MKSRYACMLHAIAVGILRDVQLAYPEYRGVVRDIERLTLLSKTRGIGLFTTDLPALDSSLLLGLETGILQVSGPCSHRVSKVVHIPRFLRGLWMMVFDDNCVLREDVDTTALAFLRQILCLGKKLELECKSSKTRKVIDDYLNIEQELRVPSYAWDSDTLDISTHSVHFCDAMADDVQPVLRKNDCDISDRDLLACLQQTADDIVGLLRPFDLERVIDSNVEKGNGATGFRHGPGSVADMNGRRGLFDKYDLRDWPTKLQATFPIEMSLLGFPNDIPSIGYATKTESPSRLMAVPKTAKGPRLIASEPTAHQWCQQLLASYLIKEIYNGIGRQFIDFKDQSKSARMVSRASTDRANATVDLSSASDRLSLWAVERIFRKHPSFLRSFHAVRTRQLSISPQLRRYTERGRKEEDSKPITLRKFASQGTGLTFPVQSVCFLIVAIASIRASENHSKEQSRAKLPPQTSGLEPDVRECNPGLLDGIRRWRLFRSSSEALAAPKEGLVLEPLRPKELRRLRGQVRVYGDDIIVARHGYAALERLLHLLQLKVNVDKTFLHGFFRESCGSDCYKGDDVTPVKPKRIGADKPLSIEATIELSNNLFEKGFWHASEAAASIIKESDKLYFRRIPVRTMDSGLFGFKSFVGEDLSGLKTRWNTSYQRTEYRSSAILHKIPTLAVEGLPALLRFFHEGSSAGVTTFQRQLAGRGVARKGYSWVCSYA